MKGKPFGVAQHHLAVAVETNERLERLERLLERVAQASERQAEAMEFLANRNTLGAS